MACFGCSTSYLGSRPGVFAALSRAAAKSAAAKLRSIRVIPTRTDWPARAAACERCPLRVVSCGISYCGTPFLRKIDRDPGLDGCGCPTVAKAKDPAEHCPLNTRHRPARRPADRPADARAAGTAPCDCKWCLAAR